MLLWQPANRWPMHILFNDHQHIQQMKWFFFLTNERCKLHLKTLWSSENTEISPICPRPLEAGDHTRVDFSLCKPELFISPGTLRQSRWGTLTGNYTAWALSPPRTPQPSENTSCTFMCGRAAFSDATDVKAFEEWNKTLIRLSTGLDFHPASTFPAG